MWHKARSLLLYYIPRVDLWSDLSYTESYEPVNATYLELRENPNLSLFVSKALYVRQLQSQRRFALRPATETLFSLIRNTAHEMCSRWLTWVKQAEPVSLDRQTTLAERDLLIRNYCRTRSRECFSSKDLWAELANQLIHSLWSKEHHATMPSS